MLEWLLARHVGFFNPSQVREKLGTQAHDLCSLTSSQADAGLR